MPLLTQFPATELHAALCSATFAYLTGKSGKEGLGKEPEWTGCSPLILYAVFCVCRDSTFKGIWRHHRDVRLLIDAFLHIWGFRLSDVLAHPELPVWEQQREKEITAAVMLIEHVVFRAASPHFISSLSPSSPTHHTPGPGGAQHQTHKHVEQIKWCWKWNAAVEMLSAMWTLVALQKTRGLLCLMHPQRWGRLLKPSFIEENDKV